jgi:FkbH-like protein
MYNNDNIPLSYYFNKYKNLNSLEYNYNKNIKVAFLTSNTSNGLKETMSVLCFENNIKSDIYLTPYAQYNQEILNNNSTLYTEKYDLIFFSIDIRNLLGDFIYNPYALTEENRIEFYNSLEGSLATLFANLLQKTDCYIIVQNFNTIFNTSYGILENDQEFGLYNIINKLNFWLIEYTKKNKKVIIFDYNNFISNLGKENAFDEKLYHLGDIILKPNLIPRLSNEYLRYIKAFLGLQKKCIVLDLDNTLWGGIIGESDINQISLSPFNEGKPFYNFQNLLYSYYKRGVILAINSKNNYKDAINVIQNHPHMILKENYFTSIKINWNNKVDNIIEIAKDINIGLDSIVFIDDDDLNCEMVGKLLPEVEVVHLPKDPTRYLNTLINRNLFDTFTITKEDLNKGEMYEAENQRKKLNLSYSDINEYLLNLNIEVDIYTNYIYHLKRISQLTLKTNQFNTTTLRFNELQIEEKLNNSKNLIYSVNVKDKFGDSGITGVAILNTKDNKWMIENFLLSCRVLGRNIENVILEFIINEAKNNDINYIEAHFIPSNKNMIAASIFQNNNFTLISKENNLEVWYLDINTFNRKKTNIKINNIC